MKNGEVVRPREKVKNKNTERQVRARVISRDVNSRIRRGSIAFKVVLAQESSSDSECPGVKFISHINNDKN